MMGRAEKKDKKKNKEKKSKKGKEKKKKKKKKKKNGSDSSSSDESSENEECEANAAILASISGALRKLNQPIRLFGESSEQRQQRLVKAREDAKDTTEPASEISIAEGSGRDSGGAGETLDSLFDANTFVKKASGGGGRGGAADCGIERREGDAPAFLQQLQTDAATGGPLVGGLWKPGGSGPADSGGPSSTALQPGFPPTAASRARPRLVHAHSRMLTSDPAGRLPVRQHTPCRHAQALARPL